MTPIAVVTAHVAMLPRLRAAERQTAAQLVSLPYLEATHKAQLLAAWEDEARAGSPSPRRPMTAPSDADLAAIGIRMVRA